MTTDTPRREAFENQYRKKPVVIEAMQWDGTESGWREINAGMNLPNDTLNLVTDGAMVVIALAIETLEGDMIVSPDDWIIRGIKGELYLCKPDIFAATYEAALTPPATAGDARKDVAALWVWRNGPGQFVAYNDEYPRYENGDPKTLGEPIGIATLQPYTKSPVSVAAYRTMISAATPSAEAKPGLTEEEQDFFRQLSRVLRFASKHQDAETLDFIITRLTTGGQKS